MKLNDLQKTTAKAHRDLQIAEAKAAELQRIAKTAKATAKQASLKRKFAPLANHSFTPWDGAAYPTGAKKFSRLTPCRSSAAQPFFLGLAPAQTPPTL